MLRKEQNDLVTQTGPGTPMGRLFRSYWTPVLIADELPENDCPPVRVKVLSERLVAFRDSLGRYGLIDEFCPHRGASLWFARNEECGLRCPYHGWKFDVNGQCLEVPSEPEESGFAKKIKVKSYPLVERGGVLWTYMGPPELKPPLPEWEFAMVPPAQRYVSKRLQESNWLQAMEGGIDSSHVSFLHRGNINSDPLFKGAKGNQYNLNDTPAGVRSGRERRRPLHRRAPQRRGRQLLLAHHAICDAVLHHDRAAWRSHGARPLLDPDRRRELLDLELRLSSDARDHRCRAPGDEGRQGRPLQGHPRHLSAGRQQGQRLSDGPRGAKARRQLQRHRRHRHPGRLAAGEHGPDHRSHQGEPGLDRQRHHHGAPPADARRQEFARERHGPAGGRCGASARALGRGRPAAGSSIQGRRQGSSSGFARASLRLRCDRRTSGGAVEPEWRFK